jgi:hypothetical protein
MGFCFVVFGVFFFFFFLSFLIGLVSFVLLSKLDLCYFVVWVIGFANT